MKKTIKNLYLPGTNKNVGYLTKTNLDLVVAIYARCIKYFPFPYPLGKNLGADAETYINPIILTQKEKKKEKNIQLVGHHGYLYNVDTNMWNFFGCEFKTPDNLDIIEMAYLYKNWKAKKNG